MLSQMFVDAYETPIGNGILYLQADESDPEKVMVVLTRGWMTKDKQTEYMIETSSRELIPLTIERARRFYPADNEAIRFGLELGKIRISGKELSWLEEKIIDHSDSLIKLIRKRRKHKPQ